MDDGNLVQAKIIRLTVLCEGFADRVAMGENLSPPEALYYKQALDFLRQHCRLMELYTKHAIESLENQSEPDPLADQPESGASGNDGPGQPPRDGSTQGPIQLADSPDDNGIGDVDSWTRDVDGTDGDE